MIHIINQSQEFGKRNLTKLNAREIKIAQQTKRLVNNEVDYLKNDIKYIAGVDEVGRGPIAGPVVAAAVILPKTVFIHGVNDSKKLTEKQRQELSIEILSQCIGYGIGVVSHREIDRINIRNASFLAMVKAINKLFPKPDLLLVDGFKIPDLHFLQESIIKGDSTIYSIAAASIIAKVYRDKIMDRFHEIYPQYQFNKNKGYPTPEHIDAIRNYGSKAIHRKTFCVKRLRDLS